MNKEYSEQGNGCCRDCSNKLWHKAVAELFRARKSSKSNLPITNKSAHAGCTFMAIVQDMSREYTGLAICWLLLERLEKEL